MKRIILILSIIFTLSGCLSYRELPTSYRSSRPFSPYLYDPIYDFYPNPYLYQRPRTIIITPAPRPKVYYKQEPRRNAFGPTAPPSAPRPRPQQAPIRAFPKPEDKK